MESPYRKHINPYWLDRLDLVAGYGAVSLGHHPPQIAKRIADSIVSGGKTACRHRSGIMECCRRRH